MIGNIEIPANQKLSNLIDVEINASLIPDTNNIYDIGSDNLRFRNGYFSGAFTCWDLIVESGSSIKLAGATFENKGHYTSVDTNWIVEHDDQDTAFIGVYANSAGAMTHANLILEAQGSALNLLKNSPLHPWSPNAGGIVNEGGPYGTFVDHDSEISWQHFTELTKDEYGNVTYLSGLQSLMRLNDDFLILEDVELQINSMTENSIPYFDADGKLIEDNPNLFYDALSYLHTPKLAIFDDDPILKRGHGLSLTSQDEITFDIVHLNTLTKSAYFRYNAVTDIFTFNKGLDVTGIISGDGSGLTNLSESQITDLDHFTTEDETDPVFLAWDKSTGIVITESQISDLDHFSGLFGALAGTTQYRVPFGNASGGLIDSENLTYSDSALRINNGGIYLDRPGADSFIVFKRSGVQVGQIRGADGSIDITEPGGSPVHFSMDVVSGVTTMSSVNTSKIGNADGILKLNPDATGIVEMFGDADVGNDENSKMLYVWRRTPAGNDYIRFYIAAARKAYIHTSCPMTLQAQVDFTINSVTEDIIFKVGDNAGSKKFYFKDSDGNVVAIIDSNGNFQCNGDANIGDKIDCGEVETVNGISVGAGLLVSGDLGIKVTPDSALHIFDGKIRLEADSEDPTLYFTDNDDDATFGFLYDRSLDDLHLVYNGSSRNPSFLDDMMTFTHQHRVGIMNPDPSCELDVGGDIAVSGTVDGYDISGLQSALDSKADEYDAVLTGTVTMPYGLWDVTGIAVGSNVDRRHELQIESISPVIAMKDISASSNAGVWHFHLTGDGTFEIDTKNDLHTGGYTAMRITRAASTPQVVSFPEGEFAIGTNTPSGKLTIDQPSSSAAIPVLTLDQADVSEPFIEFLGGAVATNKNGQNEYLKVKVAGNTRYLRLFN